jgi:hypothetical protein
MLLSIFFDSNDAFLDAVQEAPILDEEPGK